MRTFAWAAGAVLVAGAANAACGIEGGSVRILSNDFPALRAVTDFAKQCAGDGVTVEANLTTEHRELQVAALTPDPAEYTAVIVANSSIVPLLNDGLIRPLDDLIAKHAPDLPATQTIAIDGQVMAIAFMANAQHLFVREDLLAEAGAAMPSTYEEVLEAAEAVKAAGLMDHPFAMLTKADWNLGEEFVNMYLGLGGQFFEPGTATASINNETGVKALEMLKALSEYSDPDFLTFDLETVVPMWEAGDVAIAQLWGSSGGQILDDEGAAEGVAENTVLLPAPTVGGGTAPASTLWWDGFTIAANISDEDAEATFVAMMNGISDEMVRANNDKAVWLSGAYEPSKAAEGVAATAQAGAEPYPMLPFMGFLHNALFAELPDYLQGSESAEQTLADVEAAYATAAREAGFVE